VANSTDHSSIKDLKHFFGQFGNVKDARISIDHTTGKSRKIGFITFKKEKDMLNALNQDGVFYKEKKLKISKADRVFKEKTQKENFWHSEYQ